MTKAMYLGIGGFIGTIAGYLLCVIMVNSSHSSQMEVTTNCPFVFAMANCSEDCIAYGQCHEY